MDRALFHLSWLSNAITVPVQAAVVTETPEMSHLSCEEMFLCLLQIKQLLLVMH